MPTWMLVALGVVAILMMVGGLILEFSSRSSIPEDQTPNVSAGRDASVSRRDTYTAGRDIHIASAPPTPLSTTERPTGTFRRALGDAETELATLLGRLRDAQLEGHFPLGFFLPADYRQPVVDALEDAGLKTARRKIDTAYIACDRLNVRLDGRFWDGAPIPNPAPAEILEDDHVPETIATVEGAIDALRKVQADRSGSSNGLLVEFGPVWHKREFITGALKGPGEWAEFVGVYVLNSGSKSARRVWAEVAFNALDGTSLIAIQGRWSHAPRASLGDPFEAPRFIEIDLSPNAKPEPLDIAVRFENDGLVFGMNTRNLFSAGRHDIFSIKADEFLVRIRIRGEGGLDLHGEWRCSSGDFRLAPVES